MQVKCGTYTGTGSSLGVTGVGFQPDLVIVAAFSTGIAAHFKTTSMGSNVSIQIRADASSVTDAITALDSDGFTLGTSGNVNTSGRSYWYLAVRDNGAGDFKQGSFTGDASDGKAITGFGFQPNYVLIKSNTSIVGAAKYSTQTSQTAAMHFGGIDRADLIQIDSDGFSVNNGSANSANLVNVNAATHWYFAFKEVADFCEVFQYTGNGSDNRDITTPGFEPGFIHIKGTVDGQNPVVRTSAHSGDNSQGWDSAQAANNVQSFISTGFQVGTSGDVNTNTSLYNTLVLKEGTNAAAATTPYTLQMMGVGI